MNCVEFTVINHMNEKLNRCMESQLSRLFAKSARCWEVFATKWTFDLIGKCRRFLVIQDAIERTLIHKRWFSKITMISF